jgi:malate dehydrogenase (oxaloacetate-decarboxylating)(NADP+)
MFRAAAQTLTEAVSQDALDCGLLFPPLRDIRAVSAAIAQAVAVVAYEDGLARNPRSPDLGAAVAQAMYDAVYPVYA